MSAWNRFSIVALLTAAACGPAAEPRSEPENTEPEVVQTLLGDVTLAPRLTVVADGDDGLDVPRDLSFHPEANQLWVVNRADDSVVIVSDPTGAADRSTKLTDGYAEHFMEEVSSIAFGVKNFAEDYSFGTCQESENTYNGQAPGNFFMGPALWSASPRIFAEENPIGLGSHLDMLHHSPNCMGIAHDSENVYWVFDGYHGQLARYDFQKDHDAGYDDHSDGIILFLEEPQVKRVAGIPSLMELDHASGQLYVADTGNSRVLRVDTVTREYAHSIEPIEPGTVVEEWRNAPWAEVVPASAGLLQRPSGLALHDGLLYVGDNATGELFAFELDGTLVSRLSTGLPARALMGIEAGPDDRLYLIDATGRVLRLER